MTTNKGCASQNCPADEELIDTLIAISVVAKRLANKLRQSDDNKRKDEENGKE